MCYRIIYQNLSIIIIQLNLLSNKFLGHLSFEVELRQGVELGEVHRPISSGIVFLERFETYFLTDVGYIRSSPRKQFCVSVLDR